MNVLGVISAVAFLLMIGACGAMETNTLTEGQAFIRCLVYIAVMCGCGIMNEILRIKKTEHYK